VAIAPALATILAAIIGVVLVFYQVRKNHQLEREKQQMQLQLGTALDRQRFLEELEKMRYADRLTAGRKERERERQQQESANASAKAAMHRARTPAERREAYREAIHADPDISQLQILEMSQPLEVTKVYVRLRLHQEPRLGYEPDSLLLVAEAQRDPNALIKAERALLETRLSAAMTPEDALQKYSHCIVLGDPGAGKSTLLKYLTLKSVDRRHRNLPDLPIHIALGEFAYSDKPDLITFAAAHWNERYGFPEEEARAYMEEHLTEGSAMLLLDALDETVIGESAELAEDSYRRVLIAIDQMATRYRKALIVVTARKAGYYQRIRLNGFTELEVLDFRPEEIEQFISNWFDCRPIQRRHATADDLNAKLKRSPGMQSLAANPLLLSLILIVYEELQDLPEKRAELYKHCSETLLFKWDTTRDIHRPSEFKQEHKRQLLAEVAWHFHRHGRRYFPEGELLSLIANFLPTVRRSKEQNRLLLSEIEEENGILKEQAHGWHGFLHLTLQEYFAAQYVSDNNKLDELLKHIGDPWWEEVLSLYAGYIPDASPLLRRLLANEKRQILWKDVFHTHLLWAGRCLVAKPRIVQTSLREEVIDQLFDLLGKTPFSLTRKQVTSILLEIGGNEVRTRALAVLKDKQYNPNTRVQAIPILVRLPKEQTIIPDLLAVLKDKQDDSRVRGQVAFVLNRLKEQTITPDLLAILEDRLLGLGSA
jgi:GTPase SAR1 family protein